MLALIKHCPKEQLILMVKSMLEDKSDETNKNINELFNELIKFTDYSESIILLLQDGRVDPGAQDNYAIRLASQKGHLEIVRILLQDCRVDPGAAYNYAIRFASKKGHLEIVRLLLQDSRVNPCAECNESIRWASENGHLEIVRLLLQDSRIDPGAQDNYAIKIASLCGYLEIVRLLLQDSRVDPAAKDNYAIKSASAKGHLEIIKLLIPRTDLSKITDQKILNIAKEMEIEKKEIANVKVLDVIWNPNKDRILVPTVLFEKIRLSQADLERVSGYSAKFIVDNKIGPGAIIKITLSGGVIPYITAIVEPAKEASLPDDIEYEWDGSKVNIILLNSEEKEINTNNDNDNNDNIGKSMGNTINCIISMMKEYKISKIGIDDTSKITLEFELESIL